MKTLQQQFEQYVQSENLFSKNDHLLLAVSGGIDSVVLVHLCKSAGYTFSIAHCNFNLRGDASMADEQFVASLAERMEVPFYVKHFETSKYAEDEKLSIQEAARNLRYTWFKNLIEKDDGAANVLLTAHHANDNAETMLMNVCKGTGVKGLAGIRKINGYIRRPLLFATRNQIVEYAKNNHIDWREDASNANDDYTRNYFRLHVIPAIERVFPAFQQNMLYNVQRFEAVETLYRHAVENSFKKLIEHKGNEMHIPIRKLLLQPAPSTILFEVLHPLNFSADQCDAAFQLVNSETGKYVESSTHRILNNRGWLIIAPKGIEQENHFIIESPEVSSIDFSGNSIAFKTLKEIPTSFISDADVALFDQDKLSFPLLLRRVKTGDYFYPLGMQKKKKISRFLIDMKVPLHEKEKVWVLISANRIVWVVGMRIDNRFRVTPSTKMVLRCSLLPKNGGIR